MSKIKIDLQATGNANKEIGKLSGSITALNQGLELTSKVASAVIDPLSDAVKEGAAFEQALANTAAVSRDFEQSMSLISRKAKEVGATTEFTATQAAGAFEELARAGMPVQKSIASIDALMALASATSSDLSTSAQTVATTLGIFADQGLKAGEAVDLMVKTVGASPQNFENLREALKTSQGVAATLGISFKDLTKTIGTMAAAGFKGEQAGTALNAALSRLAKLQDSDKTLQKLGLTAAQVNPKFVSMRDIIDRLNKKGATFTDTIKLLGQEAGTKFAKLIQEGGKAFDDFAKAQANANTAADAQRIKLQTLSGQFEILKSGISAIKLTVFEKMSGFLKTSVEGAQAVATSINDFAESPSLENLEGIFQSMSGSIEDMIEDSENLSFAFDLLKESIDEVYLVIKTALIKDFENLVTTWDNLEKIGTKLSESLGEVNVDFGLLKKFLMPINTLLSDQFKILSNLLVPAFDILIEAVQDIIKWFSNWDKSISFIKKSYEGLGNLVSEITTGIKESFDKMLGSFSRVIKKQLEFIKNSKFLRTALFLSKEKIDSMIDSLPFLETALNTGKKAFKETSKEVNEFYQNSIVPATDKAKKFGERIGELAQKRLKDLTEAGKETGKSLLNDIQNGFNAVIETATKTSTAVEKNTENLLDLETAGFDVVLVEEKLIEANEELVKTGKKVEKQNEKNVKSFKVLDAAAADAKRTFEGLNLEQSKALKAGGEQTAGVIKGALGKIGGQITGVGGAMQGFQAGGPMGALVGAITELLLSNEKIKAQFDRLNAKIQELIDPIADALIPIFDELIPILEEMKPAIKLLAKWMGEGIKVWLRLQRTIFPLKPLLEKLNSSLDKVSTSTGGLDGIWSALNLHLENLTSWLESITPSIQSLGNILNKVYGTLKKVITTIGPALAAIALSSTALVLVLGKLLLALDEFLGVTAQINTEIQGLRQVINAEIQSLKNVFRFVVATLTPVFETIVGVLTTLFENIQTLAQTIDAFLGISTTLNQIFSILSSALQAVQALNLGGAMESLQTTISGLKKPLDDLLQPIKDLIEKTGLLKTATDTLNTTTNALKTAIDTLKTGVDSLVSSVNQLHGVLKSIKENGILLTLSETAAGAVGGGGGSVISTVTGGVFHDGGLITADRMFDFPGAKQGEGMIIAQEGETVLPRGESGAQNITFNINAISPEETKDEIFQLIETGIITGRLAI